MQQPGMIPATRTWMVWQALWGHRLGLRKGHSTCQGVKRRTPFDALTVSVHEFGIKSCEQAGAAARRSTTQSESNGVRQRGAGEGSGLRGQAVPFCCLQ